MSCFNASITSALGRSTGTAASILGEGNDTVEGDVEGSKMEGLDSGDGGGDSDRARAGRVEVGILLPRGRCIGGCPAKSRR